MPHYDAPLDTGRVPVEPQPPKIWPTGLRYWIGKEGLRWGSYWAIRSRRINAAHAEAYLLRHDEWMQEVAETLWEKRDG